jgi:hypothetical protein
MHSDQLHVTERMRRIGTDLEIATRLEDPRAFARPWETVKIYKPIAGDMTEYVCEENNRNVFPRRQPVEGLLDGRQGCV